MAETTGPHVGYTAALYPRVRELLDQGAQIVEVLPKEDYDQLHLPEAISLPLKQLNKASAAVLDRAKPVIVYCWDGLCDLSPRAAQRLASLGFTQVYDYASSKVDWMARGLPVESRRAGERRAIDFAGPEVVAEDVMEPSPSTQRPNLEPSKLLEKLQHKDLKTAVLTDPDGRLLGVVRRRDLPESSEG